MNMIELTVLERAPCDFRGEPKRKQAGCCGFQPAVTVFNCEKFVEATVIPYEENQRIMLCSNCCFKRRVDQQAPLPEQPDIQQT